MALIRSSMIAAALLLGGAAPAIATPITYAEQATASGSLGGTSFTNASVTLTMASDTTNIVGAPPLFTTHGPTSVTVAGVGSATITDNVEVFSTSEGNAHAGFGDITGVFELLATENAAFAAYDLATSIGPLSGA